MSAITESDGITVDPGYLSLYCVMWLVLGAIPVVCSLGVLAVWRDPAVAAAVIQNVGIAVGAIVGGFGATLAGLGVFRRGDK
jgi:hypothetical protein